MRNSKLAHEPAGNTAEVTLVIAAIVCAVTTLLLGVAAVLQGGMLSTP